MFWCGGGDRSLRQELCTCWGEAIAGVYCTLRLQIINWVPAAMWGLQHNAHCLDVYPLATATFFARSPSYVVDRYVTLPVLITHLAHH